MLLFPPHFTNAAPMHNQRRSRRSKHVCTTISPMNVPSTSPAFEAIFASGASIYDVRTEGEGARYIFLVIDMTTRVAHALESESYEVG